MKLLSHVRLFSNPQAVAHQAPPSMEFSRQEYWSGLPFPSPGDRPDLEIQPRSPALHTDSLTSELPGKQPEKTTIINLGTSTTLRDNELIGTQKECEMEPLGRASWNRKE